MKSNLLNLVCLLATLAGARASTVIPPEFAMPAGSVDTSTSGFLARPYQTAASQPNSLVWTEDQLLGLHGPNLADLTGADVNGYYTVGTVVNWNIAGVATDGFPPPDPFPGHTTGNNFSMEVLTYVEFPSAGDYTMGVNSDDGFRVAVASLTPKDRLSAVTLGQFDGGRGKNDTLFSFTVTQPGIYPIRVIYEQGGGDANISWFNVVTNDTGTNFVLINDLTTSGALNAYTTASVAPPYVASFGHDPSGFTFTIIDQISALDPATLRVSLNGIDVTVVTQKTGPATVVTYTAPSLIASGSANTVSIHFSDDAHPAHARSAAFSYVEVSYIALPTDDALPATAIDLTQRGFVYRVFQIDSGVSGILAANIAHAEAQLAGLLTDVDGITPLFSISTPGPQPDGSFIVDGIINFNLTPTSELGSLTTANGYTDQYFPDTPTSGNNIAVEVVAYLDLKPGFYSFGVNSADGFRVAVAGNPYDAFGATIGIFDFRRIATETQFGVNVQKAGFYPVRLVFFRQSDMADNNGTLSLEFYTINADGSRVAVNDDTVPSGVKAYWNRTAGYDTFVKYAGPTSFVSPFTGPDVGFKVMNVIISDGSSARVVPASVALSVDGQPIAAPAIYINPLTSLSYTPTGLQLPRTVHTATLTYADDAGHHHTNTWRFNLLRNYELPDPLFFEDFESTDVGPDPMVPTGWVQENHTGHQDPGFDPNNGNSDFYLGFVVIDKSMRSKKDGNSVTAPQELNGVLFDEATNPLMAGHCIYAESDDRQNGPPGQIQYLFTPTYDLSGKSGIVIAFDSSWEQNQDSLAALEHTTDGGQTWNPIFYWLQDGYDGQGAPDIIRDGLGNIDVATTMLTSYGDVARYTDEITGQLVGGYYGFFIKAPVTPALAPYIEGRVNDDGRESKRIELFRVPKADNQPTVQFRFSTPGTSSWYWGIDNFGVYSVPSQGTDAISPLHVAWVNGKVVISWTGPGTLQSTSDFKTWTPVPGGGTSPVSITPGQKQFYRLSL